MYFNESLGIQGNIEESLKRNHSNRNKIADEEANRQSADTENREAVEQSMTDYELDMIQTQQDLTDMQIQILEGTK